MKKRVIALALTAIMALSLAACGGGGTTTREDNNASAGAAAGGSSAKVKAELYKNGSGSGRSDYDGQ